MNNRIRYSSTRFVNEKDEYCFTVNTDLTARKLFKENEPVLIGFVEDANNYEYLQFIVKSYTQEHKDSIIAILKDIMKTQLEDAYSINKLENYLKDNFHKDRNLMIWR